MPFAFTARILEFRTHRSHSSSPFSLMVARYYRNNPESNQAMQLTASKPVVYAWSVCRRERMLRGMHRWLAAADFVSR